MFGKYLYERIENICVTVFGRCSHLKSTIIDTLKGFVGFDVIILKFLKHYTLTLSMTENKCALLISPLLEYFKLAAS